MPSYEVENDNKECIHAPELTSSIPQTNMINQEGQTERVFRFSF